MISNTLLNGTWFLDGVRGLEERAARTQRQISSGFRIQDAADSPLESADLVGLTTTLSSLQHYSANLGRVGAETSAADTALSVAIQLIDRARALATQGASSTATAGQREILAVEVRDIQQQIVSIANTSVEGRHIFGGDQDQSPPYQYNASAVRGTNQLTTQSATRLFEDPAGLPVFIGETAESIFDHKDAAGSPLDDNLFAALQDLAVALSANDTAGISSALIKLREGGDWVNQRLAAYGTAGKRVADEKEAAAALTTTVQTRISAIRDTDVVQAAIDLAQQSTAQSAAFSAQASVPRKSLFDYLG